VRKRMVGTFGGGRRACMGEQHARNNLFLLTSGLLQKLKFLPVAGERYDLKIDPNMELVLSPIPYKVMIERR
jgi:cytochrome P450